MIATDGRPNRIFPALEIVFYVLVLVGIIFAIVFGFSYLTGQTGVVHKIATKEAKKVSDPALKELKEMDDLPQEPTQTAPTVQPQPVQNPMPAPMATYTPPVQPQYQAPNYANEPFRPAPLRLPYQL